MYVSTLIIPHNLILKLTTLLMTADSGQIDHFIPDVLEQEAHGIWKVYLRSE
jgi:hypothetical protein